jgi:hypothetical protein
MRRLFGLTEVIFDAIYLTTTSILGSMLLSSVGDSLARMLVGIMALVLAGGDAFHPVPRIVTIMTDKEKQFKKNANYLSLDADYLFVFII